MAAWTVLERLGLDVVVSEDAPACCGQPFCSSGRPQLLGDLPGDFARAFRDCEAVVLPSASCTAFIHHHHEASARAIDLRAVTDAPPVFAFLDFLWTALGLRALPGRFEARVGLHPGCHGLRELRLGTPSEEGPGGPQEVDPAAALLATIDGLELVLPERADECCGFGGIFSVTEPHVSARMARDRLSAFSSVDVLVSEDPSCLLHLSTVKQGGPRLMTTAELVLAALGAAPSPTVPSPMVP